MGMYQTGHRVALVIVVVVQLPKSHSGTPNMVQVSRPKAITRSAYLADSYSGHVRRDEKRFLPKSVLRQNGASYPLGEEEKEERKGIRDGRPSSLLNTCLRITPRRKQMGS